MDFPANRLAPLRDSHRHRDRRRHPADSLGQGRSERGQASLRRRRDHFRERPCRLKSPPSPHSSRASRRSRGEHPLLVCDERAAELCRGRPPFGSAGPRPRRHWAPARAPTSACSTRTVADFVVGMLAAARIGAVVVPFTTFATASELGEQLAGADVADPASRPRPTARMTTSSGAARYSATDDFGVERRLFCPAAPQLRHVVFDLEDVARLADDDRRGTADRDGGRRRRLGPIGHRVHLGIDGHAEGRRPHPRLAARPPAQPQRDPRADADDLLFCNSPFFWVGGFAFGLLATLVAGATLVCSNAVDRRRHPRPARGRTADRHQRIRRGHGTSRPPRQLRRARPVVDAPRQPLPDHGLPTRGPPTRTATQHAGHDRSGRHVASRAATNAISPNTDAAPSADRHLASRWPSSTPRPNFPCEAAPPANSESAGPHLMQRYHRRSREESFDADGWFHTGDLVRIDVDGFVYFLGRRGAMIKTAGANVVPGGGGTGRSPP